MSRQSRRLQKAVERQAKNKWPGYEAAEKARKKAIRQTGKKGCAVTALAVGLSVVGAVATLRWWTA